LKKKSSGEAPKKSSHVLIKQTVFSVLLCMAILIVLTFLITYSGFPENMEKAAVLGATTVSAFSSGFFSARSLEKKGLFIGAVSGLLLFGVLYVAGFASGDPMSKFSDVGIKLASMAAAGMLGGVSGVNVKGRRRKR